MTLMIRAEQLDKTVVTSAGELRILKGISLAIKAGESIAITGASGSGKSTLLGLLAGLDVPSSGSISLGEHNITALNEDQRAAVRAQLVGFVFQSFQLLPTLTALENVMLPLELHGRRDAERAAADYLDRVGLAARYSHYPRQLSGGEQQRVAIARAFAGEPKILFADEPTGNLDSQTGAHIIDLLFAMNREAGTTLVLVTHEQRLADLCGRRLLLDAGVVVSDVVQSSGAEASAIVRPVTLQ
jgi:putative ABC transport system ATP-binding protein